eukprot:359394-Chlamydomonas_euryale.AAC.7
MHGLCSATVWVHRVATERRHCWPCARSLCAVMSQPVATHCNPSQPIATPPRQWDERTGRRAGTAPSRHGAWSADHSTHRFPHMCVEWSKVVRA